MGGSLWHLSLEAARTVHAGSAASARRVRRQHPPLRDGAWGTQWARPVLPASEVGGGYCARVDRVAQLGDLCIGDDIPGAVVVPGAECPEDVRAIAEFPLERAV